MNKYCPECGDEFRPEIETCPDCSVTLTTQPPRDVDAAADVHSVEVLRTRDRLLLTRLLGMFDEAGIAHEIGEGIVLSAIVGEIAQPIRVLVLESDEAQARELVEALEVGASGDEPSAADDPPGEIRPE